MENEYSVTDPAGLNAPDAPSIEDLDAAVKEAIPGVTATVVEAKEVTDEAAATQELIENPELDDALEDEAQAEALLDEVLAAQEDVPEPPTSIPVSPDDFILISMQLKLNSLILRVAVLEARLDNHNTRSGHKI